MDKPNFEVIGVETGIVLVRDLGPWDQHNTITNDPQSVIDDLVHYLSDRRLFYVDSIGAVDEIELNTDASFRRFIFGDHSFVLERFAGTRHQRTVLELLKSGRKS